MRLPPIHRIDVLASLPALHGAGGAVTDLVLLPWTHRPSLCSSPHPDTSDSGAVPAMLVSFSGGQIVFAVCTSDNADTAAAAAPSGHCSATIVFSHPHPILWLQAASLHAARNPSEVGQAAQEQHVVFAGGLSSDVLILLLHVRTDGSASSPTASIGLLATVPAPMPAIAACKFLVFRMIGVKNCAAMLVLGSAKAGSGALCLLKVDMAATQSESAESAALSWGMVSANIVLSFGAGGLFHSDSIRSLQVVQRGSQRLVLSTGDDGSLYVWDVSEDSTGAGTSATPVAHWRAEPHNAAVLISLPVVLEETDVVGALAILTGGADAQVGVQAAVNVHGAHPAVQTKGRLLGQQRGRVIGLELVSCCDGKAICTPTQPSEANALLVATSDGSVVLCELLGLARGHRGLHAADAKHASSHHLGQIASLLDAVRLGTHADEVSLGQTSKRYVSSELNDGTKLCAIAGRSGLVGWFAISPRSTHLV